MKKIIMALLCFALATPSFAFVAGKVNFQQILLSIKEGQKVRKQLEVDFNKKQATIKKERAVIEKAQQDFEKQSLVMNAKAKAKKERELQEMMMKFQQKAIGLQREMQAQEKKATRPLIDKIAVVVQEVSKGEKIDMTYEVSSGSIVYASKEIDLTDKVIKAYDKKHPAK